MNTLHRSLLVGVASIGLGVGAVSSFAETAPGTAAPHAAGTAATHAGKHGDRMAKREAELHDKLKLTSTQEPAWTAFVAKMQATAEPRPELKDLGQLTAPQRAEQIAALAKVREQRAVDRVAPIKEFYAALSPDQQKLFDAQTQHHHRHFGEHR